ncbi:hypothetical protein BUE80_DR013437 [Diplocarpon rosae]|nr:hypothetical protein BUE80_DR013437 [Diplocarpon rosae]
MLSNLNLLALSLLSAAAFAAPKSDPTAKAPAQPTATAQAQTSEAHPTTGTYEWRITGDSQPMKVGEMSDFKIDAPGNGLIPAFNADCPIYSRTGVNEGYLTTCWVESPEFSPEVKAQLLQDGNTHVVAFEVSFQKFDLKATPGSLKYTGSATLTSGTADENFVIVPSPSP